MSNVSGKHFRLTFKNGEVAFFGYSNEQTFIVINNEDELSNLLISSLISDYGYYLDKQYFPTGRENIEIADGIYGKEVIIDTDVLIANINDFISKPYKLRNGALHVLIGNAEDLQKVGLNPSCVSKVGNTYYVNNDYYDTSNINIVSRLHHAVFG